MNTAPKTYPRLTNHWWHRVFAFNEHGSFRLQSGHLSHLVFLLVPTIAVRATPFFLYLRVAHGRFSVGGNDRAYLAWRCREFLRISRQQAGDDPQAVGTDARGAAPLRPDSTELPRTHSAAPGSWQPPARP